MNDIHDYRDIINLEHPRSASHPHMSLYDRAAQFSPFSALTGYGDAIKETARRTNRKSELSEESAAVLNETMKTLQEWRGKQPMIHVTYFLADEKKDGGTYITESGRIKRIDSYHRMLIMEGRTGIPLDDIAKIEIEPLE